MYVWGCIVTVIVGFVGDRYGKRAGINLCVPSHLNAPYKFTECVAVSAGFSSAQVYLMYISTSRVTILDDWLQTGLVGYIILIASTNPALSYFAVYLAVA